MFPRLSLVWQLPHFAFTNGSVTGMPSSGCCACAGIAANKTAKAAETASFVIMLSLCSHGL